MLLGGLLAVPVTAMARSAGAETGVQAFAVDRNGSPIGHHRLSFARNGDRLDVAIDIALEVKLAFLTLYRYRHQNREVWEGDRLVSFTSSTDDNGTPHRVSARRSGDVILVESGGGRIEAPGDALPTTYWQRRFLDAPTWIDTQSGRLLSCTVTPRGSAQIDAVGQNVAADRFAVTGDLTLDLWYAAEHWVRLESPASDGSTIGYMRDRAPPQVLAALG